MMIGIRIGYCVYCLKYLTTFGQLSLFFSRWWDMPELLSLNQVPLNYEFV